MKQVAMEGFLKKKKKKKQDKKKDLKKKKKKKKQNASFTIATSIMGLFVEIC